MILPPEEFAPCGYILKPHGKQGAFKCLFKLFFDPVFEPQEWCFIGIQNKPVPFLIEAVDYPDDDRPVLKMAGIDTPEQARPYKNLPLLYPITALSTTKQEEKPLIGLEGLKVYTQEGVLQGQINHVTELSDQLLLTIQPPSGEIPFEAPCHPDLVMALDYQQGWIYLQLPHGLADL